MSISSGSITTSTSAPSENPAARILSVVVPIYNEETTVGPVIDTLLATPLPLEIEVIAVDDGSSDGTPAILNRISDPRVRVLHHQINRGKGAAIRTGLTAASGDIVVIQDADLEYDPADWNTLLVPLIADDVDVVYGSRFMGSTEGMRWQNRAANRMLSVLTSVLYGTWVTDMETCYKLIRRSVLLDLELTADRFDIEPQITSQLLRRGIEIRELPISYNARTREAGKKIGYRDGLAAIRTLLRWRFARQRRVQSSDGTASRGMTSARNSISTSVRRSMN